MPTPPRLPAPTPGEDAPCTALGLAIGPIFVPGSIDAYLGPQEMRLPLAPQRAFEVADPAKVWPGGYDYGGPLDDVLLLRGGDTAVQLELSYDFDFPWPIEATSVKAVLKVPGRTPRPIEARIDGSTDAAQITLSLPDVTVRGTLELELEAQDRCIGYVAEGSGEVSIVRSAVVDACPTGEGLTAYWKALLDPPLLVGGVEPTVFTTSAMGKWSQYGVAADGASFASWDPNGPAASGIAGDRITVATGNRDLGLTSFHATFYRRAAVAKWPDLDPVAIASRTPAVAADGTVRLRLPDDQGRYVAVLGYGWDSPCLRGDTFAIVSIDDA